jgi:hypothetical protein
MRGHTTFMRSFLDVPLPVFLRLHRKIELSYYLSNKEDNNKHDNEYETK